MTENIEPDLELGLQLIRERLESMDNKREWKPAINEIRILFRNFIRQLDLPIDESVNYHQVQGPNNQMPVDPTAYLNELRSICTQTDPVSTSDEEDDGFLMNEEEDLYEELDLPDNLKSETMERLLTLDQAVDYEEVELKRSNSCQRLGLTLCYSTNSQTTNETTDIVDIFISQIEPGSVADHSGRVFIGDQILQVNGMNMRTPQETMSHFARESERIVLLLARPSAEHEEEDEEDEQAIFINDKALLGTLAEHDDSTTENSQAHEKDSGLSGLSRTDSEPEQQQKQRLATAQPDQKSRSSMERDFERELAHLHSEMENIRLECAKLMNQRNKQEKPSNSSQALSLMNMIEKLSTSYHQAPSQISDSTKVTVIDKRSCGTETPPPSSKQQKSSTFASNFLQTPKMSRKQHHNDVQLQAPRTPRPLHRQQPVVYDETTSSAYNTGGDSCRSTPNNMQNQQLIPPPRRPIHLTVAQKHIDIGTLSASTSENPYHTIETPVASLNTPMANHFRLPRFAIQPPPPQLPQMQQDTKKYRSIPAPQQSQINFQPGETMYTTADKLAETIELQQRLLRQAMAEPTISYSKQPYYQPQQNEYHTIRTNDTNNGSTYEWKVKRRADGSRYITRRPLRSQVLKAREEQLNRERTGLSTDDDAASELKTGKFWSRQERKEHIQRQREKKSQKHLLLSQKNRQPDQLIHELSHRKQMRHSGQQFFDKFTTIQEFLAHGARDPALRPAGGILSVTTV